MTDDTLHEIGEINCAWLLLAQRLLKEDRITGMARLGVTEAFAQVLVSLSNGQIRQLARSGQMLCRIDWSAHRVLAALADKVVPMSNELARAHALMAGLPDEPSLPPDSR